MADRARSASGGQASLVPAESRYLNRELSWLEFNRRVLALALDERLPLLERVRFLGIFGSNLDEFFQVRVAGLLDQVDAEVGPSADGRTPAHQLTEIREIVLGLLEQAHVVWAKRLAPELEDEGIRVLGWHQLSASSRAAMTEHFRDHIFPVLTPLAVDPAHPFPYVSNLSVNLAVLVRAADETEPRFARVKVPPFLAALEELPDGEGFVPVEQVIAAHLDELFPGMSVLAHHPFRVTRDADLGLKEGEAEDLLSAIETGLHRRRRHSDAVRLEVEQGTASAILELLMEELELDVADVYPSQSAASPSRLSALYDIDRPDLKFEPWTPQKLQGLGGEGDLFARMRAGDLLVHHPYDSFSSSVLAFLEQAARDPNVLAIKHTLYRTTGDENSIVETLTRAAEAGKQVVTLVEVTARFEEQRNIEWARRLEQSGVHVVYGLVGLKTHAKAALVVRQEGDQIRRYCHIGTGNYNPVTARHYEDVGILSSSPELGADLAELFNYLTGFSRQPAYRRILVAPDSLRPRLLELIRAEMSHEDGEIALKINSLSDPEIIDALYEASTAGVEIDIVVRGICCLRPGVPGLSENIRVRSILGRFLEHSRVFRFGSAARGRSHFLGSADLMRRKLEHRVELVVPLEDEAVVERLEEMLELGLHPRAHVWRLAPDGRWTPPSRECDLEVQTELQRRALERAKHFIGEATGVADAAVR
ncbi:MAG: polyphosphate kinase 1 [Myxococcales bacterium]|nr:polyphosphate kinase 1 [Myxococcales bacterium]